MDGVIHHTHLPNLQSKMLYLQVQYTEDSTCYGFEVQVIRMKIHSDKWSNLWYFNIDL